MRKHVIFKFNPYCSFWHAVAWVLINNTNPWSSPLFLNDVNFDFHATQGHLKNFSSKSLTHFHSLFQWCRIFSSVSFAHFDSLQPFNFQLTSLSSTLLFIYSHCFRHRAWHISPLIYKQSRKIGIINPIYK